MLLDRHEARRVLSGERQLMIRPVKDELACYWKPGHSYAVRVNRGDPKAAKEEFRVKVVETSQRLLASITDEEASHEGFPSREEFWKWWWDKHRWGPNSEGRQVWVVRFALDTSHQPRFLHQDPARGYTRNQFQAASDEGEAVGDEWLSQFAERAEERQEARLRRELKVKDGESLSDRLAQLERDAGARGIDLRRKFASIQRRLESAECEVYGHKRG